MDTGVYMVKCIPFPYIPIVIRDMISNTLYIDRD